MSANANRSEAVVDDYKQRKINRSAIYRIRQLLQTFEQEQRFDRKAARVGMVVMLLIVAVSFFWFR